MVAFAALDTNIGDPADVDRSVDSVEHPELDGDKVLAVLDKVLVDWGEADRTLVDRTVRVDTVGFVADILKLGK